MSIFIPIPKKSNAIECSNYRTILLMSHASKVKVKVTQSCLTLCDFMDYTVHGILQAIILEWVAFSFSKGSSQPRDQTQVPCIAVDSLLTEDQESPRILEWVAYPFSSGPSWPRNLDPRIELGSPAFLHCRWILNQLSYWESPWLSYS